MEGSKPEPSSSPSPAEGRAPAPKTSESGRSRVVRTGEGVPRPPRLPGDLPLPQLPQAALGSSNGSIEIPLDVDDSGTPRASWASLPPPALAFARYGVLGRLAVGGMAEIFLARESIQGDAARHLVIKVLRLGRGRLSLEEEAYFEAMFLREGRVAMQLSHPNICHTYEFGKWGGHFFIAMEWIEGLSVRDLLDRVRQSGRPMPLDVALYITAQVAAALDYAHGARDSQRRPLAVVHRDVTPHNMVLRYDGVVKLLDFGVAKVGQSDELDDGSVSGTVKGKFGYMAPEQCSGRALDGRADIFALGVCCYEMLAGCRLYQRGGQYDTFKAIIEEPAPSVCALRPDLPPELDAIVKRALAKNPLDRYDAAGDLQEALVKLAFAQGIVMSATRARRWLEELYGEDLYRGPVLELDDSVMQRLLPVDDHTPLSSSLPPPALPTAPRPRSESTGSRVVQRISSELAEPRARNHWLALFAATVAVVSLWVWWLSGRSEPEPQAERRPAVVSEPAQRKLSDMPEAAGTVVQVPPATPASSPHVEVPSAEAVPAGDTPPPEQGPQTQSGERSARDVAHKPAEERRQRRRRERRPGFVVDPGF